MPEKKKEHDLCLDFETSVINTEQEVEASVTQVIQEQKFHAE